MPLEALEHFGPERGRAPVSRMRCAEEEGCYGVSHALGSLYVGRMTRMAARTGRTRSVDLGMWYFMPRRSICFGTWCGLPIKMAGMQNLLNMTLSIAPECPGDL